MTAAFGKPKTEVVAKIVGSSTEQAALERHRPTVAWR